MTLNRFLKLIFLITFFSLVYVYQQVRIVQLAYVGQEKLHCLKSLVDDNKNLRYNISRRTSLISMSEVWANGDFEWPRRQQLVLLPVQQRAVEQPADMPDKENLLSGLFRLKSQAEATPVKNPF